MNITTRKYPRTLGEAFGGAEYASSIHIVHRSFVSSLCEFLRRLWSR